jgi:hypothetical protein
LYFFLEPTLYADTSKIIYPDMRTISILDTPNAQIGFGSVENRHSKQLLHYLWRTRMLLICLRSDGSLVGPNKRLNIFESYLLLNKVRKFYLLFANNNSVS